MKAKESRSGAMIPWASSQHPTEHPALQTLRGSSSHSESLLKLLSITLTGRQKESMSMWTVRFLLPLDLGLLRLRLSRLSQRFPSLSGWNWEERRFSSWLSSPRDSCTASLPGWTRRHVSTAGRYSLHDLLV